MDIAKIMGDIRATLTAVKDGETDPINAYKDCKNIADLIKATMDEMFSAVLDECDKYDPRELAERGIQVRNGSKRWDFSNCYEWAKLKAEISELEEQLKHRASLPQSDLVDAETGEVLEKPTYTLTKRSITFVKPKPKLA